ESFGIGIKKYDRQRHRRKQQRQAVQLRSGENKNSARDQNERAHERWRQLSDRQSASRGAGIGGVNRGVGQTIEGHRGGPRRDHGHDDPPQLPPRRQTSSRQHGSAEREWEREDRVLPLDHLQRDLKISEQAHEPIVKQSCSAGVPAGPLTDHPFSPGGEARCSIARLITLRHYYPLSTVPSTNGTNRQPSRILTSGSPLTLKINCNSWLEGGPTGTIMRPPSRN